MIPHSFSKMSIVWQSTNNDIGLYHQALRLGKKCPVTLIVSNKGSFFLRFIFFTQIFRVGAMIIAPWFICDTSHSPITVRTLQNLKNREICSYISLCLTFEINTLITGTKCSTNPQTVILGCFNNYMIRNSYFIPMLFDIIFCDI